MKLNKTKLNKILKNHQKWLETGGLKGKKANLYRANLEEANLGGADLRGANLREANLVGANLSGVNLSGANLKEANLKGADLREAYLEEANLVGADLSRANLTGINLNRTDLRRADLNRADLREANLKGANLLDVILSKAKLPFPIYQIYLGKQPAVATPDYLHIGCIRESWDWWLKNWEKVGKNAEYSAWELEKYGTMINQVYDLLKDEESKDEPN